MLEKHPREKRLAARVNQQIDVNIYYNGQFIATKQTKNFGLGGMLIETGDLGLPVYSLIELEIPIPRKHITNIENPSSNTAIIRLPAIVKRITDSSMAVAFEVVEQANQSLLKTLMSMF